VNREALLMILGAVIIIAVSLAVTFVWRKWLSRYFAPFWSSLLVLWVWRSTDRVAARLSPLFAAGGLASLLLAVTVLPALVATYYGFFSNNLLGPVLRSELINEWRDAIHGRNLDLTWCWHTLLLASAASLCYTLLSFILAHALVRESRLSMIKPFFVTNILPVCAYVVPIIAIAYPIGSLMRGMDASTEPGIIFKLAILHGFYLWPLTLTLAYGSIRKADPRPELSALIERGRFADVVRMVSIPTLKRRMIAVGLIAFAISYNELIFGVYVIQDKKFYTLPVGIAMKLVSQGDDGSPAVILVLTALTSIIAVAFATAMAFISNVHKEE
jgi:ABC-type Fe3+ transport system permease subunit